MNTQFLSKFSLKVIAALLAISFLLTACASAAVAEQQPQPTDTVLSPAITQPAATHEPIVEATRPAAEQQHYTLDSAKLASNIQAETVAAVPASDNAPYWEIIPAHTRLTLQGYPITNHRMQPQIFIYPTKDLSATNEAAEKMITDLRSLIESPREEKIMPFLPLNNASQVMHAQVQYLDFKNGQGLRYLVQFDQGIMPISSHALFYTYQGLTSDKQYYIAAVLPVNHPSLPAGEQVTGNEPPEFTSDFPTYLVNVTRAVNVQAPGTFTPDLTQLDAMMSSLEVQ